MLVQLAEAPLETIMTKLYKDMGHPQYGMVSLAVNYLSFAYSTTLSSKVVTYLGLKLTFLLSCLGYCIFDASGYIIYAYVDNEIGQWIIVLLGSFIIGFSAGCIWVAQGSYLGQICSP